MKKQQKSTKNGTRKCKTAAAAAAAAAAAIIFSATASFDVFAQRSLEATPASVCIEISEAAAKGYELAQETVKNDPDRKIEVLSEIKNTIYEKFKYEVKKNPAMDYVLANKRTGLLRGVDAYENAPNATPKIVEQVIFESCYKGLKSSPKTNIN